MAKNKDSHYNQMIEKQDKKCYYRVTKSQKSKANEQSSLKRFFQQNYIEARIRRGLVYVQES